MTFFLVFLFLIILFFYLLRRRIALWLLRRLQNFNPYTTHSGSSFSRRQQAPQESPKKEKIDTQEMMKRHLSKENSKYVDFTEEKEEQ